jgi:hypothetical protein
MTEPAIFTIEDTGILGLTVVDRAAVGYSDTWQAPGGDTAVTATLADYVDGDGFSCQITSGKLTPAKQSTRRDRAATFCAPASSSVSVGQSTYGLDVAFFQDAHVRDGITAYLFAHDTEEAYFLLGGDAADPPRATGRIRLVAGGFGGEPRTDLTDSLSFDLVRKPDIAFGTAAAWTMVTGAGVVTQGPGA